MARKGKQVSRKRKAQMPEEDEKQNEIILEEVLSISGKNADKVDGSSPAPARQRRSVSKTNEVATPPKKLNAKKRPVSPSSSPSKQKKSADEEATNAVGNEIKASASERGDPVPNLPDGWRKEIAVRKSGKSAGQIDIYFYSPDGIKLRSRPDVASYLKKRKSNLKLEDFDFSRNAKTSQAVAKKKAVAENSTVPKKRIKTEEEKSKVEVESADLSKNIPTKESKSAEKVTAEEPPVPDTEEKNVSDEKTNKAGPEGNTNVEMNGKEKRNSRVSTSRKNKIEQQEDKNQNEVEISNKKVEKDVSSAKLKRPGSRSNEVTSTYPKKQKAIKTNGEDAEANTVNAVKTSAKGDPAPNLPDGWRKEIVVRKSGERVGQIDIYFYSPDGVKLRSRPDVASYLKKHKSNLKLEDFDFSRTAKTTEAVIKKKAAAENHVGPKKKTKSVQEKSKIGEKIISTKVSKSSEKLPAEVPEEKNSAIQNSSKILKKILESKPKKSRR